MKIAVVSPSPVPFVIGGIENLSWSLTDYINQNTSDQAELIKLPSRELGFWELIETYYSFYKLDLSHFDAVISFKYPAWMVEHPHKIYYVAHCLRGLYDTYALMHLPYEVTSDDLYVRTVLHYMEEIPMPENLDVFFSLLWEMKRHAGEIPASVLSFPGPFIRKIVHYMDHYAFSKSAPEKYYAISRTVAERKEYFPENAEINYVYPPSSNMIEGCGKFSYIFMVSRLDAPKRIDLLVKAMKYVKSDIPLYIAGNGPEKEHLKELAGDDPRIHFLGFVTDDEVRKYYEDALVIPYFPKEEDYGYITVEAMMHGKPVITLKDSGGPTEFVRNFETGFIADETPESIAEKIDWFAEHPDQAEKMGQNAFRKVSKITWENVYGKITEDVKHPQSAGSDTGRKKLAVISPYSVWPPQGGGQARTYYLYNRVADAVDVKLVALCRENGRIRFKAGYSEVRAAKSKEHLETENRYNSAAGVPASDIAVLCSKGKTPAFTKLLKEVIEESDCVILSHPYTYFDAKPFLKDRPFIYEAQDVELIQKRGILPQSSVREELLRITEEAERECCEKSSLILTCSEEDRKKISELYGVPESKVLVVANGVECANTEYTEPEMRRLRKKALGLQDKKVGVFMGSWHGPNLEACEKIFEIAPFCPDTVFLLMGSQCMYFEQKKTRLPDNVSLLGLVSEEEKAKIFSAVDFALNPMLSGSGTNLKMFDYMAAGIPIITTEFGTRGIDRKDLFILAEPVTGMAKAVQDFVFENETERISAARQYVKDTFDWSVIAGPLKNYLLNSGKEV